MRFIRTFLIVSISLFVIALSVYAAENSTNPKARFENIGLADFIKFVSVKTNMSISYSQKDIPANAKITLYSPIELTNKDLLKIFYSVLKANRLVPIQKGNTIFIVRASSVREVGGQYSSTAAQLHDTLMTTIIKLKNVSVARLGIPIKHLVSPFGSIDIIPSINIIIVTDTKDRVKQITKLLESIDSSDKIKTKLIPIKNAQSSTIASELNKLFIELERRKGLSYTPVILSEDASNALIIAARKSDFDFIQNVIDGIVKQTKAQKSQKVFYLKNAVAKDVYGVIVKLLSKTPAFKNTSISYDEATNSIIVLGTPTIYNRVKSLVERLDVPRKQVYIEALIIETSLSNLSEFGVEWSALGRKNGAIGYAGNANTGNLGNLENSIINKGELAPLPGGFSLGILGNTVSYNGVKFATLGALLNALKTKSNINIVSNPRIVTLDNQKADIFVGENRPYLISQKYDVNGNPIFSYTYKDVGVKLDIMPHINGQKIIMDAKLDVKKVTENVSVGNNAAAPITLTRTTSTKISLDSGDKILISGLIENDKESKREGVPVLSSIPLLGGLFRYNKSTSTKTNLVIFLSVKIIKTQKDINKFREKESAKK